MADKINREEFRKKLEEMGSTKVREKLEESPVRGFDIEETPIAKAYLKEIEEEKNKKNFDSKLEINKESNRIARSAKNASWWAIGISIVSIIISILAIIFKR